MASLAAGIESGLKGELLVKELLIRFLSDFIACLQQKRPLAQQIASMQGTLRQFASSVDNSLSTFTESIPGSLVERDVLADLEELRAKNIDTWLYYLGLAIEADLLDRLQPLSPFPICAHIIILVDYGPVDHKLGKPFENMLAEGLPRYSWNNDFLAQNSRLYVIVLPDFVYLDVGRGTYSLSRPNELRRNNRPIPPPS